MAIVVDRSGNNPGNPLTNGWSGTDKHAVGIKELQRDYYTLGAIATFVQGILPLTSGAAVMNYIGADNAANIISGVFDPARIPVITSAVQVISSGDLTALTAGQQTTIVQGAIVTTTDGNRWLYTGTGSKTLTTSYIQLADITPDWSVIANKPSFLALTAVTPSALATATTGVVGTGTAAAKEDHQHPYPLATINSQSGTTYTLAASDHGQVVEFTSASAVALTLPNSLPAGWNCSIQQYGAGQVTISPAAGATMRNSGSFTKTKATYSEVAIRVRANGGGNAAEYIVSGDMA